MDLGCLDVGSLRTFATVLLFYFVLRTITDQQSEHPSEGRYHGLAGIVGNFIYYLKVGVANNGNTYKTDVF